MEMNSIAFEPDPAVDLATQFCIDAHRLRPFVFQVSHGLHPQYVYADVIQKINLARRSMWEAACRERMNPSASVDAELRCMEIVRLLEEYADILDYPRPWELERLELQLELNWDSARRAVVTNLNCDTLFPACNLLQKMTLEDRSSFGICRAASSLKVNDLFYWYLQVSRDCPVLFSLDEDGHPMGLAALCRDPQFPSIGNLAVGMAPDCEESGLRKALVQILTKYAPKAGLLHLQAFVSGVNKAAVEVFKALNFDTHEFPGQISDRLGGHEARFLYTLPVVTDEDYTVAAD